jgi:outer membrane receptor protein involved in Fe transport
MGAVNWFMISPADIERAEIVRGAGSAIYGSSAMGGVINFITRRPSPKSQTYVRAMFGVYDDFHEPGWNWAARADSVLHFNRQDFTHSRQIGKWGLRVSGGRSYSTGYTDHNKFARYNFSGKVDYRFANASKLTLFGNYLHDESDVFVIWKNQSEASRVEPNQANKEQDRNGITLYASYNMVLSSKAALEFRAYLNRFLMGIQFEDFNFAPAQGLGGSIQGNFLASESFSFTYGSDFKFDKVRSDSVYGERDAILVAPYFQADWRPVSRLGFTVGGRYDRYEVYSDTKYRIIKGRRFEHFSPKFGLNYQPFDKTVVRASVSNGFKFPVIFQMFFEETIAEIPIQVNPALDSEESWSYEIGLRHRFSDSWFVEANAFYTDVNGLIELGVNSSNGTANFVNLTDVIIPGFELTTNGRWWENRLGLRANFTYLNPEDRVTHQLLRHRQKYIAFLQGSYRKGDTEFQLDYKYASAQEHYLLPGIHQFVPQKVWDARILFYWGDYTFMVGVNNLANYSYTLRDKVLEENRNFFVGLSSEF